MSGRWRITQKAARCEIKGREPRCGKALGRVENCAAVTAQMTMSTLCHVRRSGQPWDEGSMGCVMCAAAARRQWDRMITRRRCGGPSSWTPSHGVPLQQSPGCPTKFLSSPSCCEATIRRSGSASHQCHQRRGCTDLTHGSGLHSTIVLYCAVPLQ